MTDDLADILFQSFVWEAIVRMSGTGRDVHSLPLTVKLQASLFGSFLLNLPDLVTS